MPRQGARPWLAACARYAAMLAIVTTACFNRGPLTLPPTLAQHPIVETNESFESQGDNIQVDVYRPDDATRHATVLLLHGSSGIHDLGPQQVTRYARTLASLGLNALVVHYFDGTGHFTASDDDEVRYYWQWVRQVRDGITWASHLPYVRARQIELLGISLGAWVGVGVGSTDPRVHRLALIGSGLEPSARDSIHKAPPALLLHGQNDEEVPLKEAEALQDALRAAGRQVQLHIYPGEPHTLGDSASVDALLRSVRFFRRRR